MIIQPSTALRNDYGRISALARETGEPVYITRNGEGDLVVMDIASFERRERALEERALVLEAEARRLSGEVSYSTDDLRQMLHERLDDAVA